ncbi:hypothetical protein [Acuticoccus mangrovi]|uniref:Uncharacterized protein n=1 Tax=Acuticoccus mangrovi TaxID=2796142 RepID=A0A934IQD2_9HYPH|nr:hypothetical protein [Acuticoccus mangrovi]MBJ3778157.1 hypothetical protein [Acuticoccus mangrovi]
MRQLQSFAVTFDYSGEARQTLIEHPNSPPGQEIFNAVKTGNKPLGNTVDVVNEAVDLADRVIDTAGVLQDPLEVVRRPAEPRRDRGLREHPAMPGGQVSRPDQRRGRRGAS